MTMQSTGIFLWLIVANCCLLAVYGSKMPSEELRLKCLEPETDPFFDDEGTNVTCGERKLRGECEMDYMISSMFCHVTCNFCADDDSVIARSFSFVDNVEVVDPKQTTLRGCTCPTWIYNGKTYTGCANPNKSIMGGWCPVDVEDCAADPHMTLIDPISIVYEFGEGDTQTVPINGEYTIDSCDCFPEDLCGISKGGCKCSSPCSVPDNDKGGPWCIIEQGSCREDYQPSRFLDPTGASDYCRPGCCPQ